ncbi:MAG: RNA polymerase sigma factor [Solirubrobacterales bacterium]
MDEYLISVQDFEVLYQKNYEKLFRAAFRITGNKEDSEDVIQETFLNAYRALSSFKHESSFDTWLYRIMLNCTYKYIKKRNHLPVKEITQREGISEEAFWNHIKSNESVEDTVVTEDLRETCIQLFLNCISKQQRISFTLHVLLALPIKEVSRIMKISESAVKTNVYRARQHMKENIEGRCSFINPNNPCHCSNWVKYAISNGSIKNIPNLNPIHKRSQAELSTIVNEISFLNKLIQLFDNQPEYMNYDEFINKMKMVIDKGDFKIFI